MRHRSVMLPYKLSVLLISLWLAGAAMPASGAEKMHLLVLNSYHAELPWSEGLMRGMRSVFRDSGLPLEMHVEYLDMIRHTQEALFPGLKTWLQEKYQHIPLQVIMTTDDPALNFLFRYRETLFPEIPVVFCSPNDFYPQDLEGHRRITGIAQNPNMSGTIALILTLHSQTRQIAVVADRNPASLQVIKSLQALERELNRPGMFQVLTDASLEDLMGELQALPRETPVVFHAFLRDAAGRTYPSNLQNLALLTAQTHLPFYTFKKIDVGHGAVGGSVISEELMAEAAAGMAVEILRGVPVQEIPVIYDTPQLNLFDYTQLKRFGIAVENLPPDSVIINRPLSLYHSHKSLFHVAGAALALLLSILAFLAVKGRHERRAREQAQKNLLVSEARYRTIIAVSNTGAWEYHRQTDFLWCSPEYFTMLGRDPNAYPMDGQANLNETWTALLHPEDRERATAFFADYLNDGRTDLYEQHFRMRHAQGHWVWIWSRGQTLRTPEGALSNQTVGTHINISALKAANEALRENEEKLQALFSAMTEMVVLHELVFDARGVPCNYRILDCNQAFCRITGIAREAAVGKTATEVYATADPPYLDVYARVALTGEPVDFTTYYAPMDKHFHISAVSPRRHFFATITSDITAVRGAEAEREKLHSQLLQAQKMEAVGVLAGGVAHDFNNLLHVMSGSIELLRLNKPPEHPDMKRLTSVSQSIQRAAQLVQQLLLFSRKAESRKRRVNLNHEVQEAVRILERTIPKMVAIELQPDPSLWPLRADPVQMEQVLINLANNAVHAMPDGGRLTIQTRNEVLDNSFVRSYSDLTPGRHVLLVVSDTGCGMDAETLKHIFDPFFTTREVGKGTGLGLASVYGIIKAHNGAIMCYSEPEQGTTFRIYLPVAEDDAPETTGNPSKDTPPRGKGETILMVDDDTEIRGVVQEALETFGYTVISAASGEEALQKYRQHGDTIDLVLMDLNMPGMGGYRCLQELLQLDAEVRVLIASGYSAGREQEQVMAAGAKGFIGKPYQFQQLARQVGEALAC